MDTREHAEIRGHRPHGRSDDQGLREGPEGVLRESGLRDVRPDGGPPRRVPDRDPQDKHHGYGRGGCTVLLPLRAPFHRGLREHHLQGIRRDDRRPEHPLHRQGRTPGQGPDAHPRGDQGGHLRRQRRIPGKHRPDHQRQGRLHRCLHQSRRGTASPHHRPG